MNGGRLRHRIDIESLQGTTPDGFGNVTQAFAVLYASVPAEIKPVLAKEVFTDAQTQSQTYFAVCIRYLPDLTAAMRFHFKGRVLAIMSIVNVLERNIELEIQCRELF